MGFPVIMGRKTFDSLGRVPLCGRPCAVWTRQPEQIISGEMVKVSSDLDELLMWCSQGGRSIFGIGGRSVYEALLDVADQIILSRITGDYGCDVFFPALKAFEHTMRLQEEGLRVDLLTRQK